MDLKLTICILCVVSIGQTETVLGKDLHAVFGNLALSKRNVLSMVQSAAARSRRATQSCSMLSFNNRLKKCPGQTELMYNIISGSPSITTVNDLKPILSNICKESECTSKCVVDAIGECYQQDLFFEFDPITKTVGIRALCDPKYDYIDSVLSCYAYSNIGTCFSLLRTAVIEAVQKYSRSPSSYTLRVDGCRAYNNYKSCINVTTRDNCTFEKAYFLNNFIKAGVSYGKCGAQTNPFFSDYAGKIQCPSDAANGNVTQTPSGVGQSRGTTHTNGSGVANGNITQTPSGVGQSRGTTHTNGSGVLNETLATLLITVAFFCISL